jgi:hypothetical protein
LIAPERFMAQRVSGNVSLGCAQTCHNLVCSLANFTTQVRSQSFSERHCYHCQDRFAGFLCHVLLLQDCHRTNKSKTKPHRPDRVRRKR